MSKIYIFRDNDMPNLFVDDLEDESVSSVYATKENINEILREIQDHRKEVRIALRQPGLNYTTVLQTEFLIEVKNTQLISVPSDWTQISRPQLDSERVHIEIIQGRHPIIEALSNGQDQYVPNDTNLSAGKGPRVMTVSGPNMGGKSSYIRQVALITILAQIGSYVPAESASLGIFDAVHTRMGASDDIFKGRSTFMVELHEASEIMSQATNKSLVILDELGRGTSTHDGVAIAYATLKHFITRSGCLVMFVTHFPMMAEFQAQFPDVVRNYHMSFLVDEDHEEGDTDVLTFLYQLKEGAASRSYGLNVAHLAQIPSDILSVAAKKSQTFEKALTEKKRLMVTFSSIFKARSGEIKNVISESDNS
ncbi:DNA mismatch repair protein msh3 [Plakobranchus ocellatus]|uniref:DNA mismatch repair protein msh3 n=1 Tax=Plakobranchus ocellatus TaxID=259542 RepID=A0AAV4DA51_9GAST|nr:DNA mismatch repair protein msh3 [Plakobranchus ocellatus]